MPKISTLIGVAGGGGIGIGIMMLLLNKERDKLANKANFITRAVDIMKQEPQVRQLLGDKMQVGKATFTDGWSKMRFHNVQVKVPIKGEHDNAYLFAYARRRDEKDKLRLYKIEASFEKIANKKLVILDRTDKEDVDYEVEAEAEQPKPEPQRSADDKLSEEKPKHVKLTKEDYKQQMKNWTPQR